MICFFVRYILNNGYDDHYRNIQSPFNDNHKNLNFLCDTWYISPLSAYQNEDSDKGKIILRNHYK